MQPFFAVSSLILLGSLAFLSVVIEARPEVIETFSNPGILGIGAKQQIIDYKPNGVEQVISVAKVLLLTKIFLDKNYFTLLY